MNLGTKVSLGVSSTLICVLFFGTFGFVSYQTSIFEKTLLNEAEETLSIVRTMQTQAMLHRGPDPDEDPVVAMLNDTFEQLSKVRPELELWLVMAPKVIAYQDAFHRAKKKILKDTFNGGAPALGKNTYQNEPPRDAVDHEAITSGKSVYRIVEGDIFRLTRPVVLGRGDGAHPKCASCHGKEMGIQNGEVIGAYSIALSIAKERDSFTTTRQVAIVASLFASLVIAGVCFYMIRRLATVPITEMTSRMSQLAAGTLSVEIPYGNRPDEIGDMARSVEVFRRNAIEKQRVEAEVRQHQFELAKVLRRGTVGEMASALVHELSQPLATITTYSETLVSKLRGGTDTVGESADVLEKINRTAHRASQVSKTIARHVRGMDPQKEVVELDDLFNSVAPLVNADARENGVRVVWNTDGGRAKVLVNATEIESVILNLAHNSIEAMKEVDRHNRLLHITASVGDAFVAIAVTDSGNGMSAETLDRLFEPFFTTKKDGMGMGLAICRTIIENHGGQIMLDLAQEQRPTIRFTIPLFDGTESNDR